MRRVVPVSIRHNKVECLECGVLINSDYKKKKRRFHVDKLEEYKFVWWSREEPVSHAKIFIIVRLNFLFPIRTRIFLIFDILPNSRIYLFLLTIFRLNSMSKLVTASTFQGNMARKYQKILLLKRQLLLQ